MSEMRHGRYNRPSVAIALCLVAMTLFSAQDGLIKWVTSDYWLIQLLFVRSCVIATCSGLYIASSQGVAGFRTARPKDHALRMVINFLAFFTYYMAVTLMPLATATTLAMTAPLFMTAMAGPLLGEHVGIKRHLIMLFGFVGVIIIVQPNSTEFDLHGSAYAITGALMFALLGIQSRRMSKTEATEQIVFYAASGFAIFTGAFMLFYWQPIDLLSFGLMVLLGLIALFAQYTIVHAYQYAKIHVIAPFEYVTTLIGAVLIITAGLTICWYEKVEYGRNTAPPINPV
jgi:drug/metabolite transporter (DMT)-like permease